MRFLKLILPVVCLLSLPACTGTMQGMKKDFQEFARTDEPVTMETLKNGIPTGYYGQNLRASKVLKPASLESGAQWNDVGDYESYQAPEAAVVDTMAPIVQDGGEAYNKNVRVFPLEDTAGESAAVDGDGVQVVTGTVNGTLAEQIYFAHGSAHLGAGDKAKLRAVAKMIAVLNNASLTVVGHASNRVDGVTDPVKKSMINLEMAQKRANAVTANLKSAGVNPAWVQAVARGDDEPNPAPPTGMSQEAADRRVEIYVDEEQ